MPTRKPFLLRIDPSVLEAVQRWAADDLRSLNGQIEFILRRALQDRRRRRGEDHPGESGSPTDPPPAPKPAPRDGSATDPSCAGDANMGGS